MNMTIKSITAATLISALLGFSGCAVAQEDTWVYDADNNHLGRIFYYERSNTDGSLDERVAVYRSGVETIEVYKENGFCANAALVTAELDHETFSTPVVTGGALLPDAEHVPFAFLEWDRENAQLDILVQFPDMELREEAPIPRIPWHLFDFDLASLTVMTPHLADRETGFDFGMALVWADQSAPDPLTWMGDVVATYAETTEHLGTETQRYELTGSAFEGVRSTSPNGSLWLDARDGHIVDAVFPAPNHPGYTDFRLQLHRISDGGAEEWDALLRAHYADCE